MRKIAILSVTLGWLLVVGPASIQAAPTASQRAVRCLAKHQKQIKRYVTAGMDEHKRLKYRQALSKLDRAVRYAEARGCRRHATYARALAAQAMVYYDGKHDRDRAFGLLAQAFKIDPTVTLEGKPSLALMRLFNDVRLAAHAEAAKLAKKASKSSSMARRLARQRWYQQRARLATRLGFRFVTDGTTAASTATRLRRAKAAKLVAAGNKLLKKNKLSAAYRAYKKALRFTPSDLSLRERFGQVQMRLGDYSGALRTVEWIRKHAGDARAEQLLNRVKGAR